MKYFARTRLKISTEVSNSSGITSLAPSVDQGVHFRDVTGADEDIDPGVQSSGKLRDSARCGRIVDHDDQGPGPADARVQQNGRLGGVAEGDGLSLGPFVSDRRGVHLDDGVGDAGSSGRPGQVLSVQAETDDDEVIFTRGDFSPAERLPLPFSAAGAEAGG